jgi:hypothetical protein
MVELPFLSSMLYLAVLEFLTLATKVFFNPFQHGECMHRRALPLVVLISIVALVLACSSLILGQTKPVALTSWVQSDGPHFVFPDVDQHIRQIFDVVSQNSWRTQDLTVAASAPLPSPQTALTSWVQSDGPHFVYEDANQHLDQLFFLFSNNTWNTQDLTVTTGAPLAAPGSALTSWVQSDGPHFVYEDSNQHLRQIFDVNNTWHTQDLTAATGAPLATPGNFLTSWQQSDGPHFVYADGIQHLRQIFFLLGNSTWNTQDLTAVTGAPAVEVGSVLTSWVQSDGPHFVYEDNIRHLDQMFFLFSSNTWNMQDLTAFAAAPIPIPGSALTSWVQSDGPHFIYEDPFQHMHQLFFLLSNDTWNAEDLTNLSGAPPIAN